MARWNPQPSFWLHQDDPDRDPGYDARADYDAWEEACIDRAEAARDED